MPRLLPNTAPPPDYYADNLLSVALHVRTYSEDLLGPARQFVAGLTTLSQDAKRLMARLISRTTPVIRVDSLNYSEVGDCNAALRELAEAQLIELDSVVAAEHLLERLKVSELKTLFPELVKKKDRKPDLVLRILTTCTDDTVRRRGKTLVRWLNVDRDGHLQRLQLAYFGDLYRDLTEFVMRDLGIMDYEDYELGNNARAFENTEELGQYLELSTLQRLPIARRPAALDWLFQHPTVTQAASTNRTLERRRNKLLTDWGRDFERSQMPHQAHGCYKRATAHPARERRVRLFAKAGDDAASNALLAQISSNPLSSEEALFAQRFGKPRNRRKAGTDQSSRWQETLWHSPVAQMPRVELHTARLLTQNGGQAWHTENALLQSLLGLVFWDIIFAPERGMFTHPFQTGPRDLYWPDFRARRQGVISKRLEECADEAALWRRINDTVARKAGRATRLVHWGLVTHNGGEILTAAQRSFSAVQLQGLFDYMLNDLGQVRSGMPDLFVVYGDRNFELVEVKGPSDQLQPNQRVWLDALCDLGIPARVVKHKYAQIRSGSESRQ